MGEVLFLDFKGFGNIADVELMFGILLMFLSELNEWFGSIETYIFDVAWNLAREDSLAAG